MQNITTFDQAINVIDQSFKYFNKAIFDDKLVNPIVNILSRGKKNALGWMWGNKWNVNGENKSEITICAESLNRPTVDICETTLHEMAHLWNFQHGIKDCNAAQYHNKRFKETAEKWCKLKVERMEGRGWALTSLTPDSETLVNKFIDEHKVGEFKLVRNPNGGMGTLLAKKFYYVNVEAEDKMWMQQMIAAHGNKEKEFFKDLRETWEREHG